MVKVSRFFLTAFYMSEVASTGYPDFFHQPQIEGRIIWGENRFDYSLRVILLSERFEDFGVSWSELRWFLWELWQQIYIYSNLEVTFSRCLSSHCFTFLYYMCPLFAENPTGSFFRAKKGAWFQLKDEVWFTQLGGILLPPVTESPTFWGWRGPVQTLQVSWTYFFFRFQSRKRLAGLIGKLRIWLAKLF